MKVCAKCGKEIHRYRELYIYKTVTQIALNNWKNRFRFWLIPMFRFKRQIERFHESCWDFTIEYWAKNVRKEG